MIIQPNTIEILKGFDRDDFSNDRISIRIKYKNLTVLVNCKRINHNINILLYDRFINYRSIKIFKRLMDIYPLGGNLKYYIH